VSVRARLLAALLEQDSFFTEYGLKRDFEQAFGVNGVQADEFKAAFRSLESNGSLVAFNLESDGLDGVVLDHHDHGPISGQDFSVLSAEIYYALGSAFPVELQDNLSEVSEAAIDGGFSEAIRLIKMLPVDSSRWTGMSPVLRLSPVVQSKTIEILQRARSSVLQLSLTNSEAAKVAAYIDSALLLADLPDPEPDLVRIMVKRIALIVGMIGFVADLKSLLWTN